MQSVLPSEEKIFQVRWPLFAPENGREQHQDGQEFQAADQHGEGADPDLEIGQHREVAHGAHRPQARPGVVDAGENGRERRDGVQAGEQQQAGENRDREPVEQHEGQHGRHGPAFHGPAVDAHRTDRMRVQHCYKLVLRLFDQQDGADHLDPAPRRPGRRRESRQQQHGQRREQGPLRKVGIGVAGGGGHGHGTPN
ncbi:hypothetical protein G6F65_018438 [Rhizopus arrhizus]|nr:hypothetical protein G6F65_018438 [Rhizopus arrhizus]